MLSRRGRFGLDRLRRSEHCDLNVRLLGQRTGRERPIAGPGHRDGQGAARSQWLRPAPLPRRSGNEDDPVAVREPALETQLPQQRAVERKHRTDRSDQPSAFLDTDRLDRFDRPAPPDREPVGPDDRHVAGKPGEAAEIQLPLDVAATGQVPCECSDLIRLSLVGRDH